MNYLSIRISTGLTIEKSVRLGFDMTDGQALEATLDLPTTLSGQTALGRIYAAGKRQARNCL